SPCCSLHTVPWVGLLSHSLQKDVDDSSLRKRAQAAKILLEHLYSETDYIEIPKKLFKFDESTIAKVVKQLNGGSLFHEIQAEGRKLSRSAIRALMKWKERLHISDHDWGFVVDMFELEDATIHFIRLERDKVTAQFQNQLT